MVGAVMLEAVSVSRVVEAGAEHAFKVVKSPGTTTNSNAIYFAADDEEAAGRHAFFAHFRAFACTISRIPYSAAKASVRAAEKVPSLDGGIVVSMKTGARQAFSTPSVHGQPFHYQMPDKIGVHCFTS
ncbi:hypothetical protein MRX96_002713 [Rhipicephalus microplus]